MSSDSTAVQNWCAERPGTGSKWLAALFGLTGGMSAFLIFGQPGAAAGNTVMQMLAFGPLLVVFAGWMFLNGRRTGAWLMWTVIPWILGISFVPVIVAAAVTYFFRA